MHQLAMTVCYFAPFEMVYWYDRPEDFANEPELALIDAVPTVWDETIWLEGEPEAYVIVARRAGDDWFIGALNNSTRR